MRPSLGDGNRDVKVPLADQLSREAVEAIRRQGPNVGRDPAILVKQDMFRGSMRGALDAAALL